MEQYIPKSVLIAEIERLITPENGYSMDKLIEFLDTLEVKEVDLEKEINKYINDNFFGSETLGFFAARTKEEPNDIDMALCAKHFFVLGMAVSNKAQKGK